MSLPVMPIHPSALTTKPNGEAYGPDDREYWERYDRPYEDKGSVKLGMRAHEHREYPKMQFRAKNERNEHDSFQRMEVKSASEHESLHRRDPLWCDSKAEATAALTKTRDDEARHAAEAAAKAETMTPVAKRAYTRRSAESSSHAQE